VSEVADRAADELVAAAYPDEHQRGHAERWLGILACQAGDRGPVRWWEIPALAPAQPVLTARRLVLCVVAGVVVGWGIYVGVAESSTGAVGAYIAILAFALIRAGKTFVEKQRHPAAALRPKPPRAIVPRWPRGRSELALLLVATVPLGLGVLPVLVRQWGTDAAARPSATPAGTYRADRLACVAAGLAWAPVGALLGLLPALGTGLLPEAVAANAAVAVAWGALLSGSYPLLKFSEVVMSADWEDRVRFLPLLEDAADRGVLRRACAGYEFRDDALRTRLIASGQAALVDHAALQAVRQARTGMRASLVGRLARRGRARVCVDFMLGVCVAAAIRFGIFIAPKHGAPVDWLVFPTSALIGGAAGLLSGGLLAWLILFVTSMCTMTLTYVPRLSRKRRLGWTVAAAAAAAALVALEGTALAEIIAFVLPAALVMACGTWACVLAFRRTHALRRRWQRAAPDVIAAATTAATLLLLLDRRLLAALPATGLLFPAAVWGSFLLWRKMSRSERPAVKAGADLVFALLLGAQAVLLLVWLANLLGMPRPEVVALRTVLGRVGRLADLPWWAWTGAWLLLAAASLAFIRWPSRLKKAARRFERWKIVPATQITKRALTGLHIGLLALVFVGLAAPSAVVPALGRQLNAAYDVAFQRELLEEGELAAYTAVSSQLAAQPKSPILARLITSLDDISPPESPQEVSATETENARLLGEAQALALTLPAAPSLDPTVRDATAAAGLTEPLPKPSDLVERAGTVQDQQTADSDTAKRVEAAADLATRVVASLISIPRLGGSDVTQIVREYLTGLIEDSPLKNTFAAWIERLPGAKPPPAAEAEVIPVPGPLEQAATAELSAQFSAADDPVTDPSDPDPALKRARAEDPLDAAVDIINQARYAQDQSGPCAGCTMPGNADDNQTRDEPPEDHPEEP
jgi:hypothetical protein